ncbi:DUF4139 domain-containing protein [Paenimyroides baculatum]|uniref:Mucoidy inhibitor MuiA family protein n=1 Tax=Paenimyroides baculatum TaxID=2608000 RepID=A0A5M6CFP5_9FLAO|nr:DUF4139 domain-containing protein [Paenimyroides baculatum]KAA5531939.1 mucoidy inhibitor MuiA family protein [Paenimyroides baculatum]
MKNILFPAAIVFSITANAQKPVFTQAQIQSARVYNNAAELKHKASVQIPSGTSEIVITNVANYLNESTVQIGVPKNVTVMSVQFTNAYVEEYDNNQDSPLVKPVKEEIAKKEIELKTLQNQLTAERKGIELLDKNQSMSNAQNFSVAELTKLLDFYKTKRTELANSINKLENQEKTLFEELNTLKGKLTFNETTTEKTSQGKLVVNVMSNTAGIIPLEVSYLTDQATWQPSYEMRIDKINEPIQMLYKAQVQQNTGIDWKNVKLSLTSGPANQNTFAPELQPWFLDYYYPNAYRNEDAMQEVSLANFSVKKEKSEASGKGISQEDMEVSAAPSTINDFTQISKSQLNITFDIDIPYTILSNGKQHSVALKDTQLPATYSYITTPKLDTNAYLIAKVKNYGDYNILPGEANVVFEGMYVGKTYVNANANEDELRLSLGKDQNISVTRTMINDKSGSKTLSSRKVQDFVYEISVRNNKKESISIIVEDQIPISSNTDIEITLSDKGGATTNTEKGKLTWDINLKPNETKKIRFGYQVKSAKDKNLNF